MNDADLLGSSATRAGCVRRAGHSASAMWRTAHPPCVIAALCCRRVHVEIASVSKEVLSSADLQRNDEGHNVRRHGFHRLIEVLPRICSVRERDALRWSIFAAGGDGRRALPGPDSPRNQLTDELRISEARRSALIAISMDAIISIDEHRRITAFNESAEQIFGYSKAEAIGAPLDMLIPQRLRAMYRRYVDRFAAGKKAARRMGKRAATIVGRRKNGEEFAATAAISKVDVGGRRVLTVVLRDVAEQGRAGQQLRFLAEAGPLLASIDDYEDTLRGLAQLAVRHLADFCIVDVVEADGETRRLKVCSRDPSRSELCERLMNSPRDQQRPRRALSALAAHRAILVERVSSRVVRALADSDQQLQLLRAAELQSLIEVAVIVGGRPLAVILLASSSPAHTYGPADARFAEELAQRAAVAIENAQLYRLAQRAIRTREDILANVAHDLRNPLNTIALQAQLLLHPAGEGGCSAAAVLETIERAAARMNRLIQDLLDAACMDAGRLTIEPARLRTRQFLDDVTEAQTPLAAAASVELRLEPAGALPDGWGDGDRLVQVFENLIGNAVRFTAPGGRITVGGALRDGDLLLWVNDTGAGISAEQLPHVFDRFWQARRSERRGAGLGLPIVKGIVEAHGGHAWVESQLGIGTTVYFTIPTADRAAA